MDEKAIQDIFDKFELPDRYNCLSDETKATLCRLCEELECFGNAIREALAQFVEAVQGQYDAIKNILYIPKRKSIRPPKNIAHFSNILFDKRVRIHRCRNNC